MRPVGCISFLVLCLSHLVASELSYAYSTCKPPTTSFVDFSGCITDPLNPAWHYVFYCCSNAYVGVNCYTGVEVYTTPNCTGAYATYFLTANDYGCVTFGSGMYPVLTGWDNNHVASYLSMNCTAGTTGGPNHIRRGWYGLYDEGCTAPTTKTLATQGCLAIPTPTPSSLQFYCDPYDFLYIALDNQTSACSANALQTTYIEPLNTCFFDWFGVFNDYHNYKGFIYASCTIQRSGLFLGVTQFPNGTLPVSTNTLRPTGPAIKVGIKAVQGAVAVHISQQYADLTGCPFVDYAPAPTGTTLMRSVPADTTVAINFATPTKIPVYLYILNMPKGSYTFTRGGMFTVVAQSTFNNLNINLAVPPTIHVNGLSNLSAILQFPTSTQHIAWTGTGSSTAHFAFTLAYVQPAPV